MGKLPRMIYGLGKRERLQVAFGGYRHTENCGDGEFYDMQNMSCEHYPVLSSRRPRQYIPMELVSAEAFYSDHGVRVTIEGGILKINGIEIKSVGVRNKWDLIKCGDRTLLMPTKLLLNTKYKIKGKKPEGELPNAADIDDAYAVSKGDEVHLFVYNGEQWVDHGRICQEMETKVVVEAPAEEQAWKVIVGEGTLYNQAADANTITFNGVDLDLGDYFKPGDGVHISGMTVVPKNNKTAIIREVEKNKLHFSEYAFEVPEGSQGSYKETGTITIERKIPIMDGCFYHENRLWGFKGSEIFASKLGDPFNFYVYDGLSTDSYYIDTQMRDDFVVGISFGGYPMFFREHGFLKIYGSKPGTYQTQEVDALGVKKNSPKSLCAIGGCLVYLSSEGFVMYDGSARSLNDMFGTGRFNHAVAGSDARRCYISCYDQYGKHHLFCFDSMIGLWMREDDLSVSDFIYDGALYALVKSSSTEHRIVALGENTGNFLGLWSTEGNCDSFIEFGDQAEDSVSRKILMKITLRLKVAQLAVLRVKIRYDHGQWEDVEQIASGNKRSVQLCIKPRRCDHYNIRIESSGDWKLYAMEKEYYIGSSIH